jgi:6-phosphogluconolactonase
MATPLIYTLDDLEALSHMAAGIFSEIASECIKRKGNFTVALPGGSTPRVLFELLSERPFRDMIFWPKVEFYWGDERCVPPENNESNYRLAHDALLSKVPVREENVHRIKGEGGPEDAAHEYEQTIRKSFNVDGSPVFDLIILGMGADGHTASLFPGSVAIEEKERLCVAVPEKEPPRVTLTLPVINNAENVTFLVAGKEKKDALSAVLEGKGDYPAALVRPMHGKVVWVVDREAKGS